MFVPSNPDAAASTSSAGIPSGLPAHMPEIPPEQVRLLLFGSPVAVRSNIALMHKLGYAEPNDWSRLLSTGRAGEVMAILTKRVAVSQEG